MAILGKWYRNLSLKRTFMLLSFGSIFLTIVLSILALSFLNTALINYYGQGEIQHRYETESDEKSGVQVVLALGESDSIGNVVSYIMLTVPVIVFVSVIIMMSFILYNTKLKKPFRQLQMGMEEISNKNLDFQIDYTSKDELGQLCTLFEVMRTELLNSNRKIWRDIEDRQRLNMAFSHDIRTPITIIKGHMQVLSHSIKRNKMDQNQLANTVTLSLSNLSRIEGYIQTMEEASSLNEIEPKYSHESIEELVSHIKMNLDIRNASEMIEFSFTNSMMENSIYIDQQLIARILDNLVGNALKFAEKTVCVDLAMTEKLMKITVTDDGIGFTHESMKKAFDPFYTTGGENHKGLGLYVCRIFAEKMSGSIEIDSSFKGGRIILRVPLTRRD